MILGNKGTRFPHLTFRSCAPIITTLRVTNMARKKVFLVCVECLSRNYTVEKRTDDPKRMELNKFCPRCGKHTLHKESK